VTVWIRVSGGQNRYKTKGEKTLKFSSDRAILLLKAKTSLPMKKTIKVSCRNADIRIKAHK
jgi:hypothetical protein